MNPTHYESISVTWAIVGMFFASPRVDSYSQQVKTFYGVTYFKLLISSSIFCILLLDTSKTSSVAMA